MFTPIRTVASALALGFAAVAAAPAGAQSAPVAAAAAAEADPQAVVAAARALVRDHYVLPETGAALDEALAKAEASGSFKGLAGPALAEAIGAVMRSVTPDGHLYINHDPRRAEDMLAQGASPAPGSLSPAVARMIALNNGGFRRMEVLPGNVRYVDHTGFSWGTPEAEAALANAMDFLRGGSAVVIDLRGNGGGSAEAVAAMASYFLPAGTELMRFEQRGEPVEIARTRAAPYSLADRPVYVLMSERTFSAAEEFAAHVEAFGFATLVGEATRGGGFNNSFFPLPGGHVISISTGKATHAKTGRGWEQTGIKPAMPVAQARALEVAHAEALAALSKTATGGEKMALDALIPMIRAKAAGTTAAQPLAAYAGRYGERTIEVGADGALTSRRGASPAARLVALGGDEFAVETAPMQRFRFTVEGGAATALEVDTPGGPQRAPRVAG